MRHPSQADMMEATRLTREGRLEEAMALLQGRGLADPPRPAGRGSAPSQPPIDLLPPTPASGGAWTADGAAPRPPRGASGGVLPGAAGRTMTGAGGPGADLGAMLGRGMGGVPAADVAVPAGASFERHHFAGAAGSRTYKLYLPLTGAGQPRPLVVMLHGCTQGADDFAAGTRMNEVAEELGLVVAYPEQSQAANASRCWNWFNAADQGRDAGEPALVAGIARAVLRDHAISAGQVFVAGLSAGGAAAAVLGAAYPDLFAAVGVHSGLACGAARDVASAFGAMRGGGAPRSVADTPVPTIVFHGDRDATVHPVNGDEVAAQAGAGLLPGREVVRGRSGGMAYTRTTHRDGDGRAMLEHWLLHGAGHAWSGGSPAGSHADPRGPDASREMARFFLGHSLAGPAAPAARRPRR